MEREMRGRDGPAEGEAVVAAWSTSLPPVSRGNRQRTSRKNCYCTFSVKLTLCLSDPLAAVTTTV